MPNTSCSWKLLSIVDTRMRQQAIINLYFRHKLIYEKIKEVQKREHPRKTRQTGKEELSLLMDPDQRYGCATMQIPSIFAKMMIDIAYSIFPMIGHVHTQFHLQGMFKLSRVQLICSNESIVHIIDISAKMVFTFEYA